MRRVVWHVERFIGVLWQSILVFSEFSTAFFAFVGQGATTAGNYRLFLSHVKKKLEITGFHIFLHTFLQCMAKGGVLYETQNRRIQLNVQSERARPDNGNIFQDFLLTGI